MFVAPWFEQDRLPLASTRELTGALVFGAALPDGGAGVFLEADAGLRRPGTPRDGIMRMYVILHTMKVDILICN